MRIDNYLKIARIVKKRSTAKDLGLQKRILINHREAKPSSEVRINDEVELFFGHRHLCIKVLELADSIKKAQALTLYEILKDERITPVVENTTD